jgi:hypothetical protein
MSWVPGVAMALALSMPAQDGAWRALEYAPAPVDNPLKGLVPYADLQKDLFPHSMEFSYLPLSALVVGKNDHDWAPLEKLLAGIAGRGNQAVFRVYLEYPGRKDVIPKYLVEGGLKVHRYLNTNTQPLPPKEVETPDYSDVNLRACLRSFVAALGGKYDGDARIGFITAGLLGTWGEWHTWPREDLWAGKPVQKEVMDAYEAAFKRTPVLLRYPAGEGEDDLAPNAARPFGYHDDSFAWATLDTGRKSDDWFYLARIKRSGKESRDKWKTWPIGGEVRPEAWGEVFDTRPKRKEIQDFETCVKETHATWLMDSGMFSNKTWSEERRRRAEGLVRKMGYEFHVPGVTVRRDGASIDVAVEIENRGVAPFYYDWPARFVLLGADGKPVRTFPGKGTLRGLLPGDPARVWKERFDVAGVASGTYRLTLEIPNPMPGGRVLRLANREQGPEGLVLAPVTRP